MSAFCVLVVHGSASGKASIVIRAVPFRSIGQTVRANERRPEQTFRSCSVSCGSGWSERAYVCRFD